MQLRTPLAKVRGLGSAKEGAEHFWLQRISGAAIMLLTVFILYAAVTLAGADYAAVKAFFANPLYAVLAMLFTATSAYHMKLGMQVIIEDYVHSPNSKVLLLLLNTFFTILVGLVCVFAIAKLSFGA